MEPAKKKISVTLDAELLAELRHHPGSVSAQLNDALRAHLVHRRSQEAWQRLLDDFVAVDGPLDTPEDIAAMAEMEQVWRDLDSRIEQMDRSDSSPDDSAQPGRRAS